MRLIENYTDKELEKRQERLKRYDLQDEPVLQIGRLATPKEQTDFKGAWKGAVSAYKSLRAVSDISLWQSRSSQGVLSAKNADGTTLEKIGIQFNVLPPSFPGSLNAGFAGKIGYVGLKIMGPQSTTDYLTLVDGTTQIMRNNLNEFGGPDEIVSNIISSNPQLATIVASKVASALDVTMQQILSEDQASRS